MLRQFHRLLALVVSAVLVLSLAPAAVAAPDDSEELTALKSYRPAAGVLFNNPAGPYSAKYRIRNHTDRAIDAAPRGSTIRIVQYAMNFSSSTQKLIRAHRRGVNVRILVDDRHNYRQHRQLRAVLGTNRSKRSFIYVCKKGCSSRTGGALHSKFLTFSKTGASKNVVMFSSANLTGPGATWGFNDNFTWRDNKDVYSDFIKVFARMKEDKQKRRSFYVGHGAGATMYFYPQAGATRAQDPIAKALRNVRCYGARGGAGVGGRTVVRVAMFGATGPRGVYLANRLLDLDNRGCRVQVITSKPSFLVLRHFRRTGRNGGIEVHRSRYDRNGDGTPDLYIHHKFFTVSGKMGNDPTSWRVFTGSQNWFTRSQTHDDELVVKFPFRGLQGQYSRHFSDIWFRYSFAMSNRPLSSYPPLSTLERKGEDNWPEIE